MKCEASVARVLAERIGLDPATVGGGLLARALHARMSALKIPHQADYVHLLRESLIEQDALIEEVVIPESWFFRDDAPFQLFREHVRTHWLAEPARAPLRVLSIPCAGGEEPYSIAIALRELGLPSERWSIDAMDVSQRSLDRAARGIYGEHAFRAMDPEHRVRYFREHRLGHELDPAVRASVRFHRGNLLDPQLFRGVPAFDVILCRNLLIYLDADSRRRAINTFDRLLVSSGLLFLGHAERPDGAGTRFEPVGERGSFAYRHVRPVSQQSPVGERSGTASQAGEAALRPETKARKSVHAEVPATRKRPSSPASPGSHRSRAAPAPTDTSRRSVVEQQPAGPPGSKQTGASLLDEAVALADRGRTRDAAERCERFLRETGPSAPAYFLLGMLRQAEGNGDRAEECLQKAVYLDVGHEDALLALALIAERRGDKIASAGYRRRAERARQRRENP
jgi:chemotaxis protein methyltransferase WspC